MTEIKQKNSNVNFVKFLAAMMVILNHSYPLTGNVSDFLVDLTKGMFDFGTVGVTIFFTYSGFFITKSLSKDSNFTRYLAKRIVRIFPPLIIVITLSVFVLGPIFTDLSLTQYFSNPSTYKYLLNMVLIPVHNLPGVFQNAPYNPTVNGSLWTLPVEFGCYILLYIVIRIRRGCNCSDKLWAGSFFLLLLTVVSFLNKNLQGTSSSILCFALVHIRTFFVGHLWWYVHDKLTFDIKKFWILAILLVIGIRTGLFQGSIIYIIVFQYLILSVAYSKKQWLPSGEWEQLSYGIYLWGFPIGQIVVELCPHIQPITHFVVTFGISCILAYAMNKLEAIWKGTKNEGFSYRS